MKRKWLMLLLTVCLSLFFVVGCVNNPPSSVPESGDSGSIETGGDSSSDNTGDDSTDGGDSSGDSTGGDSSSGGSSSDNAGDDSSGGDSSGDSTGDDELPQSKTALIRYRLNVDPVEGGDNLVWGEMPDQIITDSGALNTFAFTLTDNYEVVFRGWTKTQGSAMVDYADGATYTVAENGEVVTLYAIVELVWVG